MEGEIMKVKQIIPALEKQLPKTPRGVSLLGSSARRNSWTFEVVYDGGDREVVKVIKPRSIEDETELQNEELALERIKRRKDLNVVQYIDKGNLTILGKEYLYLSFPFIEGQDLYNYIVERGPLSEDVVLKVLASLTETILTLAEEGVLHQDIKPGNIMLTGGGEILLLDFGIARLVESDRTLIKQQGPAMYLSPEQIALGQDRSPSKQRKISFLSDIYSASVVSLHMLLGDRFKSNWKTDERTKIIGKLESGSVYRFSNQELRERLLVGLQVPVNRRIPVVKFCSEERVSFLESGKPNITPFWHLHYHTTGTKILTKFALENPAIKGGVVFLSEHLRSVENNTRSARGLRELGWKVVIDPSTYKLPYCDDHYAELRERRYFRQSLDTARFYKPQFVQRLVTDVIEFQKRFDPDFIVSPYFFVKDPDDPYLDINFSLFEETRRQAPELGPQHLFGLALAYDLIKDMRKLEGLLDQLLLYPLANAYYLRVELLKRNNRPCEDKEYLRGLLYLAKRLTLSKSVLLVQTDQSALGLLANANIAIAINPRASIRKLDIDAKLSNKRIAGGPRSEDIRTWVYVPSLLSDLDLTRDLQRDAVKNFSQFQSLRCGCTYCSVPGDGIDPMADPYKRGAHFLLNFSKQMSQISGASNGKEAFSELTTHAKELYQQLDSENIKLDGENSGSFLKIWEEVFG